MFFVHRLLVFFKIGHLVYGYTVVIPVPYAARTLWGTLQNRRGVYGNYNCQFFSCFSDHFISNNYHFTTGRSIWINRYQYFAYNYGVSSTLSSSVMPKSFTMMSSLCRNCTFGRPFTPRQIICEDHCVYSNIRMNKLIRIFVCFYYRDENIVVQFCAIMSVTSNNAKLPGYIESQLALRIISMTVF